jgi:lysophospholipase L1-like esterase
VAATAVPGTPFNLAGTVSGNRVTLTWQTPLGGDAPSSFVIEAGSASGRTDLANFDTGSVATTFVATGVPAATYYVRIRSRNSVGVSAPSNEVTLVVATSGCTAPPGAPTNLLGGVTGSTVTLSWTAPAGGCAPTSYVIQAGSIVGASDLANFDNRSLATAFTATGVDAGQYYVRVRATGASGVGAASNEVTVTVVANPLVSTSFLAFGDSITAGESGIDSRLEVSHDDAAWRVLPTVLLPLDQQYPTVLQRRLRARYPTQMPAVTNGGRSGERAADPGTFQRFTTLAASGQFGVVLIMEGTNDLFGRETATISPAISGLRQMVRDAKNRGIRPCLATIPPIDPQGFRGSAYAWELVSSLNSSIRALVVSEGATLADVNQAFNNDFGLLGIDGLHPNADGYVRIADVFYEAIKASLESRSPARSGAIRSFLGRFE